MTVENLSGAAKASADLMSAGIVLGTLTQALPPIAAVISIVFTLIRIFESNTGQALLRALRRRARP